MENFLDKINLTDENKESLIASMKEHNIYFTTLENSEIRYNKLKEKITEQEQMLNEIDSLKAERQHYIENETGLKAEIESLKKDLELEKFNIKKENFLNQQLKDVNEKYMEFLKTKIDFSDVKDDDFSSIETQVEQLKAVYPEFFNQDISFKHSFKGSTKKESISRDDFLKMTYKERLKLFNENRELYDKLK